MTESVFPESNTMTNLHTLLIADPRKYVREFLQREMSQNGYRVLTAKTGKEIMMYLNTEPSIDLIIVDPELPDVNDWAILHTVKNQAPAMPLIVHTFISDYTKHTITPETAIFVEKRGNSINSLKKVVAEVLPRTKS